MFTLFDDPEGANLLVVIVLATVLFLVSTAMWLSTVFPSLTGAKRGTAAILIQIAIATGIYFALR